jgi:thioredoxin reductase
MSSNCCGGSPSDRPQSTEDLSRLPVVIIGAGPVGLAAAANCVQRDLPFLLLEKGPSVGHAIENWAHVRLFSPWRYNVESQARTLLEETNWTAPDAEVLPTGRDLVEQYLKPLADHPGIQPFLRLNSEVLSVGRKNLDKVRSAGRDDQPFAISLADGETLEARSVIDATGTWFHPNPLGSGGYPVPGEVENAARITYGIPDVLNQERYAGKRVAVVGAGHSATTVVLDLVELRRGAPSTHISWIMRRDNVASVFGGEGADNLAARGALGTAAREAIESKAVEVINPFRVSAVSRVEGGLELTGQRRGEERHLEVDEVIVCTGFRPDFKPFRELRIKLDPIMEATSALGPLIDPNEHSCGTVPPHGYRELAHPERDFYVVGMKSYGRAPTFLMATGYEQVRSVVAALAGDLESAQKVELELPATGVCHLDRTAASTPACCS